MNPNKSPNCNYVDDDILNSSHKIHHLGIGIDKELPRIFGDTKFVCTGGSSTRLYNYAEIFSSETGFPLSENICGTDRYCMWKTGPVLWINHGIGAPSCSIVLLEVFKLMKCAGAIGVKYFRLGTCGGIGLTPGTVVISTGAVNGNFEPKHIQYVGGKEIDYDAILDPKLVDNLYNTSLRIGCNSEKGLTLCADDFYEGQMRTDGFFCSHTLEDKMNFLTKLNHLGVKNIEMESTAFASLTNRAGYQGAIVCVALLDRFKSDEATMSEGEKHDWEMKPFKIVSSYIASEIGIKLKNAKEVANGSVKGDGQQ